MADFNTAYEKTMLEEGGYKLTNAKHDKGGMTYAGISRKYHPKWAGWEYIDRGETPPTALVREFYKEFFWDSFKGDSIKEQSIAESIYDFGVNADTKVSVKLAQIVVGCTPDGVVGPKTLEAFNTFDPRMFRPLFTLAKITRYRDIVQRDPTQIKWLMGWLNRSLRGAK